MKAPRNLGTLLAMVTLGTLMSHAMAQTSVVKVDGSSTVAPISETVAEEFQKKHPNFKVTVGTSGTGAGFKKFIRGDVDICDASRPVKKEELDDLAKAGIEFIELPVAFDALTVVVNKQNTWATTITTEELKKLWEPAAQGTITKWNQIRSDWPDHEIKLFGPGTDSGTFEYFTEAIMGKSKASRGDFTASEDDNVLVKGVEGSKYAMGYFGMAYYEAHKNRLTALKIDYIKDGKSLTGGAVEPSSANVINATYNPLSRPLFIYVNKKSAQTKPEVKAFVDFYLANAAAMVQEVKYVPFSEGTYAAVHARWKSMTTGSVFEGKHAVGVKLDEVLKSPTK